ncbi:MAG: filamentous hemagglutinin family protein [Proteobacteria bacterium]|nr:filamentous hemagglutinin family protein [Pseudomonadota bacterium]
MKIRSPRRIPSPALTRAIRLALNAVTGLVGLASLPAVAGSGPIPPRQVAMAAPAAPASNATPLPCTPGSCGSAAGAPTNWVSSGAGTFTVTGSKLTVNQTSANATFNWSSFDIGANASVAFNQPSSTAIALNRIFQSSPSQIFGALTANGQVYLINQNGFVFGRTASVNVGGLLASALNLDPLAQKNGILDPGLLANGTAALASDGRAGVTTLDGTLVLGADGQPMPVAITVQAGAQLTTNAANQRLMLAAPTIDNGGTLTAAGGQVVLAAGQKVYLTASADPNLRGLLVEVDGGGVATNQATGVLSASLGNISVVGLAVNQLGRVTATTSVTENGSIYLKAQDSVQVLQDSNAFRLLPHRGGTVTLGAGSVTEVLPDTSGGGAVDAVAQPVSTIVVSGQNAYFEGGSLTHATGGTVAVTAATDPSNPGGTGPASIRIDPGAVIDVSGSTVDVPVSRNIVEVTLNASELADDPQQRGGFLYHQTVFVDSRVGTPLANVSGELALIQRDVYERTTAGGTVSLNSTGDVVVASGSTINVSGGAVNYTPGYLQTTKLVSSTGKVVDVGSANPNQTFVSVLNPSLQQVSDRWGVITEVSTPGVGQYDPGYVQGANAGTVSITAPGGMVVQGTLLGSVVAGIHQRTAATQPKGGQLILGQPGATLDARAPAIDLVSQSTPIVVADGAALPAPLTTELALPEILAAGFTRVTLASNGTVRLTEATPLSFGAGGSLSITAPRIEIASDISAPGGSVSLGAFTPTGNLIGPGTPAGGVYVADGVSFDVRGNWTNDALAAPAAALASPIALKGGSISLDGGGSTLAIGNDVAFEASGGAWLARGGKTSAGAGGSIRLAEGPDGTISLGDGVRFDAFGASGAAGGSLSLTAPRIAVGTGSGPWATAQTVSADPASGSVLTLGSALFSDFGFGSIALTADGARTTADPAGATLTVTATPGTSGQLRLAPESYALSGSLFYAPSAPSLAAFLSPSATPVYLELPATLSLSAILNNGAPWNAADVGSVDIGAGVHIDAGAAGMVRVAAQGSVSVDGTVSAPGGLISVETLTPLAAFDPGYVPSQRIEVGPGAVLDVSGTAVYVPSANGLRTGTVYEGGTISLHANRGSVVVDSGALLDFSGTQAAIDVLTPGQGAAPLHEVVGTAGGLLAVSAPESISLLGTLDGAAGKGTGPAAAGGTLSVTLSRVDGFVSNNNAFPVAPRTVVVQSGGPAVVAAADSGSVVVDPQQVAADGIDALALSADRIELAAGVDVRMGRAVVLGAPTLVVPGQASVEAPYVALGGGSTALHPDLPSNGAGVLEVTASEALTLTGDLAIQQAGTVRLSTDGVAMLVGNPLAGAVPMPGSLQLAGDLTLRARAVVTSTATSFVINDVATLPGASYSVSFEQAGTAPGVPLSVASSLTVNADDIHQGGTLWAPFGSIVLNATHSLDFSAGSLTSVSGAGATLPFGIVEGGNQWVYGLVESLATPITGIPERAISLVSPTLTMASGARIDASGGGDLYGYQWIPGPGGTRDALSPLVSPGLYAILPSTLGQYAPYDPLQYQNSTLAPGSSVYLSGGGGLAAGYYPLLPARYALLPGAVLVSVAPGYTNMPIGTVAAAADGAPIVSGYLSFGNTGLGSGTTAGFVIEPGSYAHQLASYQDSLASAFFATASAAGAARPVLPADAGSVAIQTGSLSAAPGAVNLAAATGGRGGLFELATPGAIEIGAGGASAGAPSGTVRLGADVLASWQPGTIVLGGTLGAGDVLTVTSTGVTVDAGATVSADEVLLAANGGVHVAGGTVRSTSASAAAPSDHGAPRTITLAGSDAGGAALLAVSDLGDLEVARSGPALALALAGTVTLDAGSSVATHGSVALDAPGGASIADGSVAAAGAAWSLGGASSVELGATTGTAVPGTLGIDDWLLGALSQGRSVRIATSGAITFDRSLDFGASGSGRLQALTLVAGELRDGGSGDAVHLSAETLTIEGAGAPTPVAAGGSGQLLLEASTLNVGPGSLAINGFGTTTLAASDSVRGRGVGALATAGDLAINTGYVTVESDGITSLTAGGTLSLGAPAAGGPAPAGVPLGGTLSLTAATVRDDGVILAPSGVVDLSATGSVTLGATSVIDVGGRSLPGVAIPLGTPGGRVAITAGGAVTQSSGSRLAIGGGPGSDGGVLAVTAGGPAALAGAIDATGANPGTAEFSLEAGSLADFATLNAALEAGAVDGSRAVRVGAGDLRLAAGTTLTARNVLLEVDGGVVQVAGTIRAAGSGSRPMVELDGATGVSLAASAVVDVSALDDATKGGRIVLATRSGALELDPSATFVTGESSGGYDSQLVLRAPVTGSDLALSALPGSATRFGQVVVQPWWTMTLSSGAPSATEINGDATAVGQFVAAHGASIGQRLGLGANGLVSPLIELTYQGDLTLGNLNLGGPAWRFAGAPATVAFNATGNLTVNGTISDGFVSVPAGPGRRPHLDLGSDASSTIVLTAGASPGAASLSATRTGQAADLMIAAGSIVRTGTGDVVLGASRDVVFGAGSAAYTGGLGADRTLNLPDGTDYLPPLFAAFPGGGGSIVINAGRDVVAAPVRGTVGDWQSRLQLGLTGAASWGVDAGAFDWTVGALGGGDVRVRAGGSVRDLAAAAGDTALSDANGENLTYFGGGNLDVVAGRDLMSGLFYVGQGSGRVTAYGALGADRGDPTIPAGDVGTLLLSGDASYRLFAVRDVTLEGDVPASAMYSGTVLPELDFYRWTPADALSVVSAGGDLRLRFGNAPLTGVIGTAPFYQTGALTLATLPSNVAVVAASGDLTLEHGSPLMTPSDRGQLVLYAGQNLDTTARNTMITMSDAPDALVPSALAPYIPGLPVDAGLLMSGQSARHTGDTTPAIVYAGGDIGGMTISVPKAIEIYAGRDITDLVLFATNTNDADTSVEMAGGSIRTTFANLNSGSQIAGGGTFDLIAGKDIDLGFSRGVTTVGTLTNPFLTTSSGANINVLAGLSAPLGIDAPGAGPHGDFLANVVLGSLDPATGQPLYQSRLESFMQGLGFAPTSAAEAANQFRGLTLTQQLPLLTSVLFDELVRSGREYNVLPTRAGQGSGSGQLGSALNQSNLVKLIDNLIAPSPVYQQQLVAYVEAATGRQGLDYASALSAFEAFPAALQVAFRYVRGYTAIASLFPGTDPFDAVINHVIATDPAIVAANAAAGGDKPFPGVTAPTNPFQGDFSMTLGRLYTLQGGSINVLAPGGSVDVGLANTPPAVSQQGIVRKPSDLGIVTEQSGDINILTEGDVLVNSSRVFTLGGGDIAIWSSAGSIDAGRGAKSAISAPPPVVTVDASGRVQVTFGAAVAGSGIRTIITSPTASPGNVDLVAPVGTVNAGDAGIGASGNLNIAAASVAGLNNITVGGTATGVPPQASGIGVTVSGAANAASSSTASSTATVAGGGAEREQASPLAQSALNWLEVFVTGLGEEGCRPDDLDCLKRQPKH